MAFIRNIAAASLMAALCSAALAQAGPGGGPGQGPGPAASSPRMGMGPGMGPGGMRQGGGPRMGADYTSGWAMMTPEERKAHQERMQSLRTHDECRAYMEQHHQQMAERAKDKGGKPLGNPRRDACAGMRR